MADQRDGNRIRWKHIVTVSQLADLDACPRPVTFPVYAGGFTLDLVDGEPLGTAVVN